MITLCFCIRKRLGSEKSIGIIRSLDTYVTVAQIVALMRLQQKKLCFTLTKTILIFVVFQINVLVTVMSYRLIAMGR